MNGEVNYVSDLRLLIKIIGGWINMEQLHEHNQKTYENICRMKEFREWQLYSQPVQAKVS